MSDGFVKTEVFGARVATSATPKEGSKKMTYYPAFTNAKGKEVSARLTIPVLVNVRNQEQPSNMQLTAWGKMADICAKALSPGREISFIATPGQYQSQYKIKGQPVLIEGKPLNITGYSYRLDRITFGAESAAFIKYEIDLGLRKENWFKPGNADAVELDIRRKGINSLEYTPGIATFGYASVDGMANTTPAATATPAVNTPPATALPQGVNAEALAAALAIIQGQQAQQATTQPATQTAAVGQTIVF